MAGRLLSGFPTDLPTPRFEANTDVDDAENNSVALENGEERASPVGGPLSRDKQEQ